MAAEAITVLLTLRKHGRMGRYSLSSTTGMGEGVVRRVLNELRDQGAIRTLRGGAELTDRGRELLTKMLNELGVVFIDDDRAFTRVFNCECRSCYVALVRRSVGEGDVVKLRDVAIKNGADAVLFLRYDCAQGRFAIPRLDTYFEDMYGDLSDRLHRLPNLECGATVLIVCGQSDYQVVKSIVGVVTT